MLNYSGYVGEMPDNAISDQSFAQVKRAAVEDVNRWRGSCMEQLARLDRAVNEVLAAADGGAPLPQAFPKRLNLLRDLTGPQGQRANKGLHRTVGDLIPLRAKWRDILAHATSRVLLDRPDAWVWFYSMPQSNGKADLIGTITKVEAQHLEKELRRKVNCFKSILTQSTRS